MNSLPQESQLNCLFTSWNAFSTDWVIQFLVFILLRNWITYGFWSRRKKSYYCDICNDNTIIRSKLGLPLPLTKVCTKFSLHNWLTNEPVLSDHFLESLITKCKYMHYKRFECRTNLCLDSINLKNVVSHILFEFYKQKFQYKICIETASFFCWQSSRFGKNFWHFLFFWKRTRKETTNTF